MSQVPISITAITQEMLDRRASRTSRTSPASRPESSFDTSQTNQISIRGIASSGGSGTTGIYIDDMPIQVRALGFNSDDALLKLFDLDRVEVLRGPQGTLFGAGSEGGTVRYITTQPSLTKTSIYARAETSYTEGGAPSYEAGVAGGHARSSTACSACASAPGIGATAAGSIASIRPRSTSWTRTRISDGTTRAAARRAVAAHRRAHALRPASSTRISQRNDVTIYWPEYSDPSNDRYVSANPTPRPEPGRVLPARAQHPGGLGRRSG